MNWQYSVFSTPLFVSTGISIVISYIAWRRRKSPGAKTLVYLMWAIALWTLASGVEKLAVEIPEKIFWSKIQYVGITSTPVLFMIFAFRYCQYDNWLRRSNMILLWVFPIITILIAMTNDWHHLLWSEFAIHPENSAVLIYGHGPWFWFYTAFGYLCVLVGVGELVWSLPLVDSLQRRQIWGLIISGTIPWIGNILYILGWNPFPEIDFTPYIFSVSGIIFAISLFSFQLFDITPVARSRLVDTMQDAVIVINQQRLIADINPAALSIMGISGDHALGKLAEDGLTFWPRLAHNFRGSIESPTIQRVIQDVDNHWYDCRISPLRDSRSQPTGWLVVLRDITAQRKAEIEIKRLATVVEQANETIVITDLNGKITYANPFFEVITGYTLEEAIGQNPNILKSGYQSEDFYKEMWTTISSGKTWEGIFTNRRKDGSIYQEAATIFPIKTSEGQITNYAAVKRDITQQIFAENELQEFSDQLSILHEISIELSLATAFDELCRLSVELGNKKLDFDHLRLWIVDPKNAQYLRGTYRMGKDGNLRDERPHRRPTPSDDLYNLLLYSRSRVFYKRNHEIRDAQGEVLGLGEIAVTGLWDGHKMIGYLAIDNLLEGQEISRRKLEIFSLYGQILGNLLIRNRVMDEVRASARQQELLNEITQAGIQQIRLEDMLQVFADRTGELLHADGCYITLWDEKNQSATPIAAYGSDHEPDPSHANPYFGDPAVTEAALNSGEVLAIEDVTNTRYINRRLAGNFPTRACLILPLIANRQKLGITSIVYNERRKFTKDEVELSRQAAQQIALAVLKAKLLEESEHRVKESETLRKASAAIVATLNQQEAIDRILEELNRVVPYDSASVLLRRGDQMEIVGGRGFPEESKVIGLSFPLTGTPNATVFDKREPYILEDAPASFEAFRKPPHNHIRGWMGVPLNIHEKMIGMISLDSFTPDSFTADHERLATAFADQVAIALENTRLFEETQRLAIHDPLTGLYNRRYFMELAIKQFKHARRYQHPLSIIMIDIDHFKNINDSYGHLVGDLVLQAIAQKCQTSLRGSDVIGRYGGEEFVILLPETPIQKSLEISDYNKPYRSKEEPGISVAERLRKEIERLTIRTDKGGISATISLGIAESDSSLATVEKLIDWADLALLQAKQLGRNQIVTWPFEEIPNSEVN